MRVRIPICRPIIGERELYYITKAVEEGWIAKGRYISEFEQRFANYCGCKYGVAVCNGTAALHLALASLDVGKGDEVIIPAFTMAAVAFAVVYTGAKPVLVDADPETWCMSVDEVEWAITDRTRAIIPVHIYGHPCNMDELLAIADEHNLHIIEDCAEAHGAEVRGKKVGSFGDMGCFSFYSNKIITTGEGGMIVTDDRSLASRARYLGDMAFEPELELRFFHQEIGYNYRLTNLQAALGLAQLERIEDFIKARQRNAKLYTELLAEINGITLPVEEKWAKNVYWMYGILIEDNFGISRDKLMLRLAEKGIETRPFFTPMHQLPCFRRRGLFENTHYPVAEELGHKGLLLPSGSDLTLEEIEYIVNAIKEEGK
ncbi:hypothetical protein DRP04_01785 [Archaeoglobales archaeon]|nr:MAG: hypothetical protein DRP04_01785 [Archaeoglobales archaeon]